LVRHTSAPFGEPHYNIGAETPDFTARTQQQKTSAQQRAKATQQSGTFPRLCATFEIGWALALSDLPALMQSLNCPKIGRELISFSALCIQECTSNMDVQVTTTKRVGRTMEVKRRGSRRYHDDEQ
jgi:hypothetical protein